MKRYLPRLVDAELSHALQISGAVELLGPRACGKTETASRQANSVLKLDVDTARATLAQVNPFAVLDGEPPQLLDEWQLAPGLWNAVRREVDDRQSNGQFILTGSASPDDTPMRHTGAGRVISIRMRTMSFAETGHSTKDVSLAQLFSGKPIAKVHEAQVSFHQVVERIVSGGWPGALGLSADDAQLRVNSWLSNLVQRDFPSIAGSRRNPRLLEEYLRAIGPLVSQPASLAAITARISEELSRTVSSRTIAGIHDFAARMYAVEDQPAWSPKLRSRSVSSQAPVRHLCDPSLAAAALNAGPDRLLADLETLGFLFESQVVHDLRVYAQSLNMRGVFHYRDTKGRDEIDAVVEAKDGSWVGFEVKLGERAIEAAAANLTRVAEKIAKPPAALVVVVPTGLAYTRPQDGVHVVPLTVLTDR